MVFALDGVRVLEVGTFVSAPYCGKLFAGYGANVVKVEPPDGDISRAHGPFAGNEPNPETSALYLYLNTGKKSVVLDLGTSDGREAVLHLVRESDIVIENFRPADLRAMGLSYDVLRAVNPRVVLISITAYGQDGPYSDFRFNNLTAFAMGGHMYITGTDDGGPLKNGGYQADYQGGLNAFSAGMLALLAAERDGEGDHVDISQMQCMAPILEGGIPFFAYMGLWMPGRRGNQMSAAIAIYPCIDGQVGVHVMARNWPPFCRAIGRTDLLEDSRFETAADRMANNDELMAELYGWAEGVKKREIYEQAGRERAPIAFVHDMRDLVESPQLAARGSLQRVDHPQAGPAIYAGPPWWIGPSGWEAGRAPLLGEHTIPVLEGSGLEPSLLEAITEEPSP
ncbi:MAG TPA: CoA transferase [Dehalococcoidia bacterium]|nr:CoA transferase [Dehalococcoidia bacterium]